MNNLEKYISYLKLLGYVEVKSIIKDYCIEYTLKSKMDESVSDGHSVRFDVVGNNIMSRFEFSRDKYSKMFKHERISYFSHSYSMDQFDERYLSIIRNKKLEELC